MGDILIPFSSGLDSTYLVHDRVSRGFSVKTVYFKISNNEDKSRIEDIHRSYLIEKLQDKHPGKIEDYDKVINVYVSVSYDPAITLSQPPIWMLGLAFSPIVEGVDVIEMAYVMNDDAMSYMEEIRTLFKAYQPFCTNSTLPKIEYPLSKFQKETIHQQLPVEYRDYTWTCENPIIDAENDKVFTYHECGTCHSCKRSAFHDLGVGKKFTYNKITKYLKRIYNVCGDEMGVEDCGEESIAPLKKAPKSNKNSSKAKPGPTSRKIKR